MKRKVYETKSQKLVDFFIGFIGWFFVNIGLAVLVNLPYGYFIANPDALGSNPDQAAQYLGIITTLSWCIPLVLNVLALIFFAFTRYWIALGALAAFAASLIIAICLGVLFAAACFTILSGYGAY
jgi:hypothetical protein